MKLNTTALQAKIVSVMTRNSHMKAVSKMLTAGFKLEKINDTHFNVLIGKETQQATLVSDRFVVISYSKPKGAKEQKIFLTKSVFATSIKAQKVIVIDLQEKTIENGDMIKGLKISEGGMAVKALMSNSSLTTVRNYINHNQLYIAQVMDKVVVADNIKEIRQVFNSQLEIFAPANIQAFTVEIETVFN